MTFTLTIPYLVITLAIQWVGVIWLAIEVYQTVRLSEMLQATGHEPFSQVAACA